MRKKIKVGIIFGGKSAEHEVSLQSAKNIIEAIDKKKYEVVLIGIDKKGKWLLFKESDFLLNSNNPKLIKINDKKGQEIAIVSGTQNIVVLSAKSKMSVDVMFPVLHGPFGEDGTIQGLLKLANIPFVGAGVLGSAVGMDKDIMKRLLNEAQIPVAKFIAIEKNNISFESVVKKLGLPFFVKPANLGSSVGISKVKKKSEFSKALQKAFLYDNKILLEECILAREIECSVLGNDSPVCSVPGEIVPCHEFYSYEAKYIDENGAVLKIPAKLSKKTIKQIQELAIRAFRVLGCEGLARVDLFLLKNNKVLINEINTMPGFTKISMYPKLWEISGISYSKLIDKLIQLSFERFKKEQRLKNTY